jgi:hypothetical protein
MRATVGETRIGRAGRAGRDTVDPRFSQGPGSFLVLHCAMRTRVLVTRDPDR